MQEQVNFYLAFAFYGLLDRKGIACAQQFAVKYKISPGVQKQMVRMYIQKLMTGTKEGRPRDQIALVKEMAGYFEFSSNELQVMAQEVYKGTVDDHDPDWPEHERKKVRMHVYQWFMDGDEDALPEISATSYFRYAAIYKLAEEQAQGRRLEWLVASALCSGCMDGEFNEVRQKSRVPDAVYKLLREADVF